MAMTKKERAEFDAALKAARIAGALRWTTNATPDVLPPTDGGIRKGFLFSSSGDYPRIEPACTSSVGHAFGQDDKTTSQRSRRLYSTRLLAMRAMRNEIEQMAAEKLAKVDAMIAEEESK